MHEAVWPILKETVPTQNNFKNHHTLEKHFISDANIELSCRRHSSLESTRQEEFVCILWSCFHEGKSSQTFHFSFGWQVRSPSMPPLRFGTVTWLALASERRAEPLAPLAGSSFGSQCTIREVPFLLQWWPETNFYRKSLPERLVIEASCWLY